VISFVYINILLGIIDFLPGLVFINKKRGFGEQSTSPIQDKQNEEKQAKDSLNKTLNELNDLEKNDVGNRLDKGLPVRPKDFRTAKQIEEEFPEFFDEDSGNSDNKKQGYGELKEYLQSEFDALPGTKESSATEGSIDRDTKKQKLSTSDSPEGKEKSVSSDSTEGKEKPSSSETKDSKELSDNKDNKESPVDFVLAKQASEMPDIPDADGGGD